MKQKLLAALGITLDDVSEERLLDILLDAYKAKQKQIQQLEGENGHEREMLHAEREKLRDELHRVRSDPLYGASGQFWFLGGLPQVSYCVTIQSGKAVEMYERHGKIDYRMQAIPGPPA